MRFLRCVFIDDWVLQGPWSRVNGQDKAGKQKVAVVGAGRVGTALGRLLHEAGYPIAGVVCRTRERADEAVRRIGAGTPFTDPVAGSEGATIVLVTVPDEEIGPTTARIAAGRTFDKGDLLVHTSGALPADVLRVQGRGAEYVQCRCLSMHPIQTVADREEGYRQLKGATFGLEGDPEAVERGIELVQALGGTPVRIKPGAKALYHAAACVGSNYLVTLIQISVSMYEQAGLSRAEGMRALLPLLQGTLGNVERLGVPEALTGPIERGDTDSVLRHLEALAKLHAQDKMDPSVSDLYRLLGRLTVNLVKEKRGALSPGHESILKLLDGLNDE